LDEIEEKKWIITRLDHTFQLYEDLIKNTNSEFSKFKEKELSTTKSFGKAVLAGTAFVISLILGILAINNNLGEPVGAVSFVLLIGMVLYLGAIGIENRVEKILTTIERAGVYGTGGFYMVKGYFEAKSTQIEQQKLEDYQKLMLYVSQYVFNSLYLGYFYSIKESLKFRNSLFISVPLNKELKQMYNIYKKALDITAQNYEKEKVIFEDDDFFKPLLRFGNSLLDYKNGKVTIPEYVENIFSQQN